MEDLTEEPELEECEEQDEEDEDEDEEPGEEAKIATSDNDENTQTLNLDDTNIIIRPTPVRNSFGSFRNPDSAYGHFSRGKHMLETNFSITGINEIKTNQVARISNEIEARGNNNDFSTTFATRPTSLDLRGTYQPMTSFGHGTRPESVYVERVTAKLLDSPQ